jgi:hypothetical protein
MGRVDHYSSGVRLKQQNSQYKSKSLNKSAAQDVYESSTYDNANNNGGTGKKVKFVLPEI